MELTAVKNPGRHRLSWVLDEKGKAGENAVCRVQFSVVPLQQKGTNYSHK